MATIFFISVLLSGVLTAAGEPQVTAELLIGFTATPDRSYSSFQPLLKDFSGNYSLGFLRVQPDHLSLSVVHLPSGVPLWSAAATSLPRWGGDTRLFFNGSLVLSDLREGVFWSTQTSGGRVSLSNSSNLIIQNLVDDAILWQSFDFPTDTIVENQNFTATMVLVSSNGLYSMRLGADFIGLYAKFAGRDSSSEQIYHKHGALEPKSDIVEGNPIYLTLKPDGFLGMFQTGSVVPVDVEAFKTFQRNLMGPRLLRLEPDGNLKGYYWTGSIWSLDYEAISDFCQLPSSCGSFGLCRPSKGCSCLDKRTYHGPGTCAPPDDRISGDFCSEDSNRFAVVRATGVELPFKELMGYQRIASIEACEASCAANCTCWGVVYSNSSGFCYALDFPVQTVVSGEKDETKMGYFKVRQGVGKSRPMRVVIGVVVGVLIGVILVILGIIWVGLRKSKSRGVKGYVEEEGVAVGPYKDLGSTGSSSIESSGR